MTEQIAIIKFTKSEDYLYLDSEIEFLDDEEIDFMVKQLTTEIYILEDLKSDFI